MFQKTVQHFWQGWDPEPRTSFCKRWEQGNCNFGSACHFAHGERELRGRAPVVAASVLSPGGGANVAVNVPTPPPAVPPQAQGYGYSESSGSDWGCEGCGGCGCGGYGCGGCGSCSGCAGGCPAGCCGSGYSKGCNSCGCGKGAGCGPCGSCGGAGCGPCNGAGCGPCGPCGCGKGGPCGCGHSACGSSCAPHSGPCHAGPCGPCGPGGPHGSCAGAGACGCGGCGPSCGPGCGPGCGFGCGACGFQGEHMEAAGYLLSCRVQSFGPFLRPRKLNLWWDMVPGRHGQAVQVFLIMMKRSQSGNFFSPKKKFLSCSMMFAQAQLIRCRWWRLGLGRISGPMGRWLERLLGLAFAAVAMCSCLAMLSCCNIHRITRPKSPALQLLRGWEGAKFCQRYRLRFKGSF